MKTFIVLIQILYLGNAFHTAPKTLTSQRLSAVGSNAVIKLQTHLHSSTTSETTTSSTTPKKLSRDRYVATNRFQVRPNKSAAFEKRWATRKSRLATLDGFKYFHLMRRVSLESSEDPLDGEFGNYVSFTVWDQKKDFNAWRRGDAFKEAHGGTSIAAFLSTMVSSALILKGAPKPAFYDGLLFQSTAPDVTPELVDGWRNVEADGINCLPAECFVACNQFHVPAENSIAFEQRWANRDSVLKECDGFVAFSMLRRQVGGGGGSHGDDKGISGTDDPSYVSTTIWKDRESFNKWREGNAFKAAHGNGKETVKKSEPLWIKPPTPIFYEGTLVISTEDGA
eukprot:CAMPEP_0172501504 /NCGR_PEP_ID=MMETSP1066-20121228/150468_1 /TAXON_ID=671091 /ORGANISM="Coscinodiscus wailesii, Strain CCMP2513" /LENGTH=338 /DNA_ID=CAMNT_0013276307 /DNA_START=57 /DNA_END=1073 /DNA_ORIENTATION=-